jgi:hypothetical protein
MTESHTIKFGPAVTQKDLEKLLTVGEAEVHMPDLKNMKARIEFIGDFDDVRKVIDLVKKLGSRGRPNQPAIADAEAREG